MRVVQSVGDPHIPKHYDLQLSNTRILHKVRHPRPPVRLTRNLRPTTSMRKSGARPRSNVRNLDGREKSPVYLIPKTLKESNLESSSTVYRTRLGGETHVSAGRSGSQDLSCCSTVEFPSCGDIEKHVVLLQPKDMDCV